MSPSTVGGTALICAKKLAVLPTTAFVLSLQILPNTVQNTKLGIVLTSETPWKCLRDSGITKNPQTML